MRYIALLRGINVGGKNKVPMAELKAAFEDRGFQQVQTYINSGNVLFNSGESNRTALQRKCEEIIEKVFKLKISVAVISGPELTAAVKNAPPWWNESADSKHNAIFVIPPVTTEEVIAQVGEIRPEYEKATAHGSLIFWTATLKTYSRTRWSKIVGTPAYEAITIRNANTTTKLAALAREDV